MLSKSDTPVSQILEKFSKKDIEVTFLVPTQTGLEKSIMDATLQFRNRLLINNVHNYSAQGKGQENKIEVKTIFLLPDSIIETRATLYRPNTKNGDPRIWFSGLGNYANSNNLLAIIFFENKIFVVNSSRQDILATLDKKGTPLFSLVKCIQDKKIIDSLELLDKMRVISQRGYIPSLYTGDTSIGIMLAHELGIREYDMSKGPDYKGIEIKSHRLQPRGHTRFTLFSQIPNWSFSRLHSGLEILQQFGYLRNGRLQLYCTVSALHPNPQGLYFSVKEEVDILYNYCKKGCNDELDVVLWEIGLLRDRLLEKHPETFWVDAEIKNKNGVECFHYSYVEHTRSPKVSKLGELIKNGIITMDYTLSLKESGMSRDHGYLFKIFPTDINKLIPTVGQYHLS